ncbi:MAG: SpoIID/LytB domain-containing protein [Elusimicrobiota bacterium]|jgi:stage II sporulation protein D
MELSALGRGLIVRCLVISLVTLFVPSGFSEEAHHPWFENASASRGTVVETPSLQLPQTVRIRILRTKHSLRLTCSGAYAARSIAGGKIIPLHGACTARRTKKGIQVGRSVYSGGVRVAPANPSDYMVLNGRRCRGAMVFQPLPNGRLDVVEHVGLEEYLYGVLPREVGADWPLEALKAQAVVSRTYMVANLATDPDQRYDVANDVSAQVYGGLEDEASASNEAVDQTRGEILTNAQGKPLQTFFHSSCGGKTETPEYVWSTGDTIGFTSIKDPFCKEDPFYHWELNISEPILRARLRRAGFRVSEIKQIKIARVSPSGRAWIFLVKSSSGKREILGNRFRMAVGPEALRSTMITEITRTKRGFHFEGRGWGHGVGLCQWGALGRAKDGQTYQQILEAYYPRAVLSRPSAP